MNWLNKMERKFGRFAVPNLIIWLIGAYTIGFVLNMINPNILGYLMLSPYHILRGQVWRLFTWIFMPTDSNLISLVIMALFYYQLGTVLERNWGTFRFNVYIFGGMLFTVIGAFLTYGIMYLMNGGVTLEMLLIGMSYSTSYINMSIFLAFAVTYPEMEVLLMFIIPIKMKWMALVYGVLTVFSFFETGWAGRIAIFMSLFNFIIFFFSTRNYKRYAPHEVHRRQKFKAQMRQPAGYPGGARHKCAVCGRTEKDDPTLEFRFCSKCEGDYEYCQDHLFTHQHMRRS
ncbi:MAG: rhomboid family intramembrane serine protease [Roseburia sp.]|nr:rhomboid family intramembrane serine protease [Roseburia sp.]